MKNKKDSSNNEIIKTTINSKAIIVCIFIFNVLMSCGYEEKEPIINNGKEKIIKYEKEQEKIYEDSYFEYDLYKEKNVVFKKRLGGPTTLELMFIGNIDWVDTVVLKINIRVEDSKGQLVFKEVFDASASNDQQYKYINETIFQDYLKSEYSIILGEIIIDNTGVHEFFLELKHGEKTGILKAKVIAYQK